MSESKKAKHHAVVVEDIEFADGKVRQVRPLSIKQLRKFVPLVDGLEVSQDKPLNDETVDKMTAAAAIILEKVDPELVKDLEKLEDAIDLNTFSLISQVAMGTRLADPEE